MTEITEIKSIERLTDDSNPIVEILINEEIVMILEEDKEAKIEYNTAKYTEDEIKQISKNFIKKLSEMEQL